MSQPITDLVIDTNVLIYLDRGDYDYQDYCISCKDYIIEYGYEICIDDGFDFNEALNRSHIAREYLKHCLPGTMGYILIRLLAEAGKIKVVSKRVPDQLTHFLTERDGKGWIKPADRHFIKVAFNSNSKIFITEEHEDFPVKKRRLFKREFQIDIIHSWENEVLRPKQVEDEKEQPPQ